MAAEVAAPARETGGCELLLEARLLAATDLLERADPAFRAELDEFARPADATRQPRFRYAALARRAMLALLGGRFAEADAWADPERASRARAERDGLVSEVTSATGLAGRARRLGDQPERPTRRSPPGYAM